MIKRANADGTITVMVLGQVRTFTNPILAQQWATHFTQRRKR